MTSGKTITVELIGEPSCEKATELMLEKVKPLTPTILKSILRSRPIFHKCDETIRGHVFCSFLALVLKKELDRRLEQTGHCFEWADIKQDLKSLQEIILQEGGKSLAIRSECKGTCGKVFQSVGVAIPPTIREL